MFPATDVRDPTIYDWKRLLESGFPFVKVKTIRHVFAGVDISDLPQILAARGYDVSLAERALAEFSPCSAVSTEGGTLGRTSPQHLTGEHDILTRDHFVMQWLSPKRKERSVTALADRARDAGQWDRAAQLYRKALDRNLRNSAIWVQYGHALKESGERRDPEKLAKAEAAYRKALSLDPSVADTHLQLGHVLKLQGKTSEAEAAYLRAFALGSMPYPEQELSGLGWSESHLAELQGLLGDRPSPAVTPPAAGNSRSQPKVGDGGAQQGGTEEQKGISARRRLNPVKTLFPGSVFSELSVTDSVEAARILAKSATAAAELARFSTEKYSPSISIILPIHDTPAGYFREVTQSIFAQTYTNWEMCIVDDGSRREETIAIRQELERSSDTRI
jgi:tetratricopeptide (TPR) repeat protein